MVKEVSGMPAMLNPSKETFPLSYLYINKSCFFTFLSMLNCIEVCAEVLALKSNISPSVCDTELSTLKLYVFPGFGQYIKGIISSDNKDSFFSSTFGLD